MNDQPGTVTLSREELEWLRADLLAAQRDPLEKAMAKLLKVLGKMQMPQPDEGAEPGDGEQWFVLGVHTPNMPASAVYAVSSADTAAQAKVYSDMLVQAFLGLDSAQAMGDTDHSPLTDPMES